MPIPTPSGSEDSDSFIQRCMSDEKMTSEFPDEDQRMAVCRAQLDESFVAESFEDFYSGWAINRDKVLSIQAVPDGDRVFISRTPDADTAFTVDTRYASNELSDIDTFVESISENSLDLPSCLLDVRFQGDRGYVIDVLEYQGEDVRDKPLNERESILRSLPLDDSLQVCKPAKVLASDKVGAKFDIQDFLNTEGVNTVIIRETDSVYNDPTSQAFISLLEAEHWSVNSGAVDFLQTRIEQGDVDTQSDWGGFDASDASALIGSEEDVSQTDFARVHLAIDPDSNGEDQEDYGFPVAKQTDNGIRVFREGVIAAKQRASQIGDTNIEDAADSLLTMIDGDEEQITESTVEWASTHTLKLREAEDGNLEIVVIEAGKSLNVGDNGPLYYSEEALQDSVDNGIWEGAPLNLFSFQACDESTGVCQTIRDHLPPGVIEAIDRKEIPYPTGHIGAYLREVVWDDEAQAVVSKNPEFFTTDIGKQAESVLRNSLSSPSNHPPGVSIVASGLRSSGEINGESVTSVDKILEVTAWLDIVDFPAAGGAPRMAEAIQYLEQQHKETNMIKSDQLQEKLTCQLKQAGYSEQRISEAMADVWVTGDLDDSQLAQIFTQVLSQMESADSDDSTDDEPSMESIHETYKLAVQKAQESELDTDSLNSLLDEVSGQALSESNIDELVAKFLPSEDNSDEDDELKAQVESLQQELAKRDTRDLVRSKLQEANLLNDPAGERILTETQDQVLKAEDIDQLIQREQDYKSKVAESVKLTDVNDNPEPDNGGDVETRAEKIANL